MTVVLGRERPELNAARTGRGFFACVSTSLMSLRSALRFCGRRCRARVITIRTSSVHVRRDQRLDRRHGRAGRGALRTLVNPALSAVDETVAGVLERAAGFARPEDGDKSFLGAVSCPILDRSSSVPVLRAAALASLRREL